MTKTLLVFDHLAALFAYPTPEFPQKVAEAQEFLDRHYPDAAAELQPFSNYAAAAPLHTLEETFTRSFDVQSLTTLDLGYVLFGDDYKRGELLVHLGQEHRQAENPCGRELADHLPNVLRLLPRLSDEPLRSELVDRIVAPALRKIIGEFDPQRLAQKNAVYQKHHKTLIECSAEHGTIYLSALRATYGVLQQEFSITGEPEIPHSAGFLKSVDSELKIETE